MTLLETHGEEESVRRAAAGDRRAFDALVRRHQGMVQAVAYGRLGSFEDARDAAQAAFVAAWRGLPRLREPAAFGGWLRALAENESLMLLRRTRPTVAFEDAPTEDAFAEADLRLTLRALPEAEREALLLCALGGLAVADAASLLGVARTTVESRLRNARARLRRPEPTMTPTEKALIDHRLPDDFATKLPLPYDEFDFTVRPPVPEPLGEFRRAWLRAAGLPEPTAVEPLSDETTRVTLADGRVARIQYTGRRGGIEDEATLLPVLRAAGLPVPALLAPPVVDPAAPARGAMSLVEEAPGIGLDAWAASAPQAGKEAAMAVLLDARDAMASVTDAVLAAGVRLERCTLADELARTARLGGPWFEVPEFALAVRRLEGMDLDGGVVFSNGGNPPWTVRVDSDGRLLGYAGFAWARLEDPHYGVTKTWTYDAWPWRGWGFVERYLERHGLSNAEFAPRLTVRALATLQRECAVKGGDAGYRESLLGWLRRAMGWL